MGSHNITERNCLGKSDLKILREWDYSKNALSPDNFAVHSTKKVWWKCKNGHSWKAIIQSRTRKRAGGCPYCSGVRASNNNNLIFDNKDFMTEWNYSKNKKINPYKITAGSGLKVWWKCKNGHEWKCSVVERNKGQGHCRICRSLGFKYPDLLGEWNWDRNKDINANDIGWCSGKKVWWKCSKCKNDWFAAISNRSGGKQNCPYCSGKRVGKDNCLASVNSDLAKEWHPTKNGKLTPYNVTGGCNKKVVWLCKNGHEWSAQIGSRNSGIGCPECNNGITLFNGVHCDSLPEAFYYLKYLKSGLVDGVDFLHDKQYSNDPSHIDVIGKVRYDFYFPRQNEYIEVTAFSNRSFALSHPEFWFNYFSNIIFKHSCVQNILHGKFKFIQKELTKKERYWVEQFREVKNARTQKN